MNKEDLCNSNDISNFAFFPPGSTKDITEGTLAVFGVPADSLPPRRPGSAAGPMVIRKMVSAFLQNYLQSPSLTVLDLEKNKESRFLADSAGVDLGDISGCEYLSNLSIAIIRDLVDSIKTHSGIPVILGGDARLAEALIRNDDNKETGVLLISNTLKLPATIDGNAISISSLIIDYCNKTPLDLLCVGINGFQDETAWMEVKQGGAGIITAAEIHSSGVDIAVRAIKDYVGSKDDILCCLDMSVLDIGYAAGTPITNVGGLTPEQLLQIADKIQIGNKLAGIAVTNIAPLLDKRKHTENVAAQALLKLLGYYLFE
ncbi:MAG: hypothetical protein CVV25_12365, partial [Ignavibacteriae bacterium HGW-Ignavibacteriae-4]